MIESKNETEFYGAYTIASAFSSNNPRLMSTCNDIYLNPTCYSGNFLVDYVFAK